MLWGFFKKVVVADNAAFLANKVFALSHPSFPVLWAGVLAFAVQIYADFSGYTDIARGTARLLGIELMRNFNHPYIATSPADFWRRWHISLSTWLRDFIYIPLGGSRASPARASFNLVATFALSGLWHGASWNYVLWGLYWGVLILVQRFLGWLGLTKFIPKGLKIVLTLSIICFGWLLFRERSLARISADLSQSIFSTSADQWWVAGYLMVLLSFYTLPLVIHLIATTRKSKQGTLISWSDLGLVPQAGLAALLVFGIVCARSVVTSGFIYFQF